MELCVVFAWIVFAGEWEAQRDGIVQNLHKPSSCHISDGSTGVLRITTFRSTRDRLYDGGPVRL